MTTEPKVSDALRELIACFSGGYATGVWCGPEIDRVREALPIAIAMEAEIERLTACIKEWQSLGAESPHAMTVILEMALSHCKDLEQQIAAQAKGAEETSALMQRMEAYQETCIRVIRDNLNRLGIIYMSTVDKRSVLSYN